MYPFINFLGAQWWNSNNIPLWKYKLKWPCGSIRREMERERERRREKEAHSAYYLDCTVFGLVRLFICLHILRSTIYIKLSRKHAQWLLEFRVGQKKIRIYFTDIRILETIFKIFCRMNHSSSWILRLRIFVRGRSKNIVLANFSPFECPNQVQRYD